MGVKEETVRWTVTVSKATDVSVRSYLAQKGFKKRELPKFIEDAVRQRVFEQIVREARARNALVPPGQIENAIEEALTEVRAVARSKQCTWLRTKLQIGLNSGPAGPLDMEDVIRRGRVRLARRRAAQKSRA